MVPREPNRSRRSVSELVHNLIAHTVQEFTDTNRMIAAGLVLVEILGLQPALEGAADGGVRMRVVGRGSVGWDGGG